MPCQRQQQMGRKQPLREQPLRKPLGPLPPCEFCHDLRCPSHADRYCGRTCAIASGIKKEMFKCPTCCKCEVRNACREYDWFLCTACATQLPKNSNDYGNRLQQFELFTVLLRKMKTAPNAPANAKAVKDKQTQPKPNRWSPQHHRWPQPLQNDRIPQEGKSQTPQEQNHWAPLRQNRWTRQPQNAQILQDGNDQIQQEENDQTPQEWNCWTWYEWLLWLQRCESNVAK